jgi:hypothetical protein
MNAASDLVFGWEKPGSGKWTLTGFLFASLAVHAFGFYLFQIVYPPAVALLPPPGRVSLIAPNSDEERQLLRWIEAEDPALASTGGPPPGAPRRGGRTGDYPARAFLPWSPTGFKRSAAATAGFADSERASTGPGRKAW